MNIMNIMNIDCGDSGCLFTEKKIGMRTNSGCRCLEKYGYDKSIIKSLQIMLPELLALKEIIKKHDK